VGRAKDAKLTTLFRLAQYSAWREILRTEVQLRRFEHETDPQLTNSLMVDIVRVLAVDSVRDGVRGMVWAEEQRGIGEQMIIPRRDTPATCRGYANFARNYEDVFAAWMDPIARFMLSDAAIKSHRIQLLEWALLGLVMQLDEEHAQADEESMERARNAVPSEPAKDAAAVEKTVIAHANRCIELCATASRRAKGRAG
jgi:hypothetical protein